MKKLNSYHKETSELKERLLSEVERFFSENQWCEDIDIEKVEGCEISVRGNEPVGKINKYGVHRQGQSFDFDELDMCDLSYIIDIINMFIDDFEKTMKRCES